MALGVTIAVLYSKSRAKNRLKFPFGNLLNMFKFFR